MKSQEMIIVAVVVIAVAAGAFFGGRKYQQSQLANAFRSDNFGSGMILRNGRNGQVQGNSNFRPVAGEIIKADSNSITVKMQDGSTKIVLFSDNTDVGQFQAATKDDLKVGANVMVVGQSNSDGSVTAQNIQLNPPQRQGGNGNGGNTASPNPGQ
ncbi:hypothetical protein A2160_01320 [Candidatus Beckwithbacteria bacterium RBG_13_42_9]|uniref:DUF5666 domain-containing protein n=1 Tax=Candidatus Beckwithbacteria bacterium RBG_13_42_9 TaxID=1797457 RepID=A0A1F5E4G5_9BACT|nr:MAG: hypothetical protein A2160_01320 [Candidatus Beckwithbacteria bacterium RBG_13_42_9]